MSKDVKCSALLDSRNSKRLLAAILLTFVFCVCFLTPARADEVDIAVEAFAIGGAAVGVPISASEKAFVKPLVRCISKGRLVIDCTRESLIGTLLQGLPAESQRFAGCIASRKPVSACASQEVLSRLPPQ